MKKIDLEKLQKEIEKKARKREKRKKPKMKVTGAGVKILKEIIIKRGDKN